MPFFTYKAIDSSGEIVNSFVEGDDIDVAYNSASSSGLHVLDIREANSFARFYALKISARGIKPRDVIEFANNLYVMLRAGLPLTTSLSDISDTLENRRFGKRIADIRRMIELGSSFSSALSLHQDIFPEIFIRLVAVGEETGGLDKSLLDIVVYLQRMEDLKNAIKRALIYPAFAIVTTTGALLFWLIYVLPKITGLFKEMGVQLPLLTRFLIAASDFSRAYWYVYVLVPVSLWITFKLISKNEKGRFYIDHAKLKLPIVKLIVFNKLQALFAEQMRILLSAGLTIDRSFDIIIKLMDNEVFKKALQEIRDDIVAGNRLYEAVKKHGALFPNLVTRLLHVGEETGDLPAQLNYLAEEFLKKLNDVSLKMEKMIEPIVIIIIGGIFMVIIAGLMLPIYNLVASMGSK